LYVSGHTEDVIVHHGVLDPSIAFLPKPLTPASLLRRIRAVLDQANCLRHSMKAIATSQGFDADFTI
jgi:hypothetical protein